MGTNSEYLIHKSQPLDCLSHSSRLHTHTPDFFDAFLTAGDTVQYHTLQCSCAANLLLPVRFQAFLSLLLCPC
jgi:hypothetical protein